ncbi:shiftless antiviral inhibitor of ribosomal frameshifting protein homolog [Mya arenaria]|uniref:shiftless antiviral inhibitor of ribosomal frameshifting protein homolog n=1 Tax=Mya arenaria TaxID=6604 RepID=UPI0022E4239A|nr:shiftless antiviral inhibitor of ribosomal frameshifting protein homolog [Mya arenaria]
MADTERVDKFLRLREALKGKVKDNQVMNLLCHCNWGDDEALRVFTEERDEAVTFMGEPDDKPINIADLGRDHSTEIDFEVYVRQFSCKGCDHMWWRRVRAKKTVSKCFKCKQRFDALPRDKEYGWARFICTDSGCERKYNAFGAMDISSLGADLQGKSKSICRGKNHHCGNLLEPTMIIRPMRGSNKTKRRNNTKETHQCTAYNCFNRIAVGPGNPLVQICVHPWSLPRIVIKASSVHAGKDPPVWPFLDQSALAPPWGDPPYNPPTFE